jgi:hypothetical protein
LARRGDCEPAVGDVIGSTTLAELRGLVQVGDRVDAVVADHGGPAPPSVGIGEPVGTARARLAERDAAALVVRDGRVVGCISRAELDITVPSSASSAQATPHETIAAAG